MNISLENVVPSNIHSGICKVLQCLLASTIVTLRRTHNPTPFKGFQTRKKITCLADVRFMTSQLESTIH
jgi:hypothetical protein